MNKQNTPPSFNILLVEDNEADVELIRVVLNQVDIPIHLHVTSNGEEAIDFLNHKKAYTQSLRPDLIVLDLNLPKKDGREVLREIKKDLDLCAIPIIILTSSASEDDIYKSYQLHANSYIVKPIDFQIFKNTILQMIDFWYSVVNLPKGSRIENKQFSIDYERIFDSLPILQMLMLPNPPKYTIVAANQLFLKTSMKTLDQILGRGVFEVFPVNPNDPNTQAINNWHQSLFRTLKNRIPDKMSIQKYNIRRSDQDGDEFEERFWNPINIPILDDNGEIKYILLRSEDVTELVHTQPQAFVQNKDTGEWEYKFLDYAKELQTANEKLSIQDENLKIMIGDLQTAEEKYRSLVEMAPDAFVIVNESGIIEVVNKQMENWFGYSREELIGKSVEILIPERFRTAHIHHRQGFMADPKTRRMGTGLELFARRKNGSEFPVEISLSPTTTRQGNYVTSIIRDISEQKKNEQALIELNQSLEHKVLQRTAQLTKEIQERKECEENTRLIIDSISDYAIYTLNPNGYILSWSTGAEKLKGYKTTEVLGKNFSIFYSKEDIQAGKPALELKIATLAGKYEDESLHIRKDGSTFWANVIMSAIRNDSGKLKGFVKIVRDITERKNAALTLQEDYELLETRVKERTQELVHSNQELENFAYIASHDLQTPLRHITSYVQLLVEKIKETTNLDAKTEKWIHYILEGSLQMKNLIDDLLIYSRIGRIDITIEEVNLTEVLQKVCEELRATIEETKAEITYDNLPSVFGVRSQLYQLFQNLIENAIKFRKPHSIPVINIRHEDLKGFWKFYITDNGIGIDPKHFNRIFAMFQRLHTSSEYSGTGIGLAICKKIVEYHGGAIGVTSDGMHGSTFFFTLRKKS